MRVRVCALRLKVLVFAAAALASCDSPDWINKGAGSNGVAHGLETTDPLPPLPAWAGAVLGQPLKTAFPGRTACIGSADEIVMRHVGRSPGVKVIGWAWDERAKAPFPRVVLATPAGVIVGAGATDLERLDVPAAQPQVTSQTTGWWAITSRTQGLVEAYGVAADGQSICKLGQFDL